MSATLFSKLSWRNDHRHASCGLFTRAGETAVSPRWGRGSSASFAEQLLDDDAAIFSWLITAIAVGSLIAIALMLDPFAAAPAHLAERPPLLAVLGPWPTTPPLPWAAPRDGLLGAGRSLNSTAAQIYLQKDLSAHARGRLMALYTMIGRGAPLLGILVMGFVTGRAGYGALRGGAMLVTIAGSVAIAVVSAGFNAVSRNRRREQRAMTGSSGDGLLERTEM
jgi:hypothetical protein